MLAATYFILPVFHPHWQLYTIPPVRSGILAVEEAAKEFVLLEEQEKEREEREKKQREKLSSIDVGGACMVSFIHTL